MAQSAPKEPSATPGRDLAVARVGSRARARSQYSFGGERVVTRHEKARGSGHVPTWAAPMRGQHAKLARPAERILRVKMRVRVRCECVGLDGRGGHGSAGRVSVMGGGCLSGIRGTDDALDTSGVELLVRVLCRAKAQVGPGVERWPPEHQRGCNVLEPLRHLASWTNDTYDMYMLHVHV